MFASSHLCIGFVAAAPQNPFSEIASIRYQAIMEEFWREVGEIVEIG
jgi:hypothetical protein